MITKPSTVPATTTISNTFNIFKNQLCFIVSSSLFFKIFIHLPKPLPQMQNRIAFARKQSGHAHSRLLSKFVETTAKQLVRDEDLSLVLWKLLESFVQQIKQQISRIDGVRTCLYRWQQVFERERFLLGDRLVQRD